MRVADARIKQREGLHQNPELLKDLRRGGKRKNGVGYCQGPNRIVSAATSFSGMCPPTVLFSSKPTL
jgi:hypothetical protein